jgi:hypothetical protein
MIIVQDRHKYGRSFKLVEQVSLTKAMAPLTFKEEILSMILSFQLRVGKLS